MLNSDAMDKVKLAWSKTNRWHRGLLLLLAIETHWIPGGKVGFTCNDPALSHEFTGDTITAKHLFATIFLLPLAVLLFIERAYHSDSPAKARQALKWYKEYIFGVLVNVITVQALKLTVGSPRPHFFDTCGPKEAATCQESEYVADYTCTKVQQIIAQSNTSFPSGHTSLAIYAGLFLIYYLQRRAKPSNAVLTAQISLSILAVFCGLSRMLDHRHHWWDVLAGAVLALPLFIYIIVLCNNFVPPSEDKVPTSIETDSNGATALSVDSKESKET